jgi:hypothetical protein
LALAEPSSVERSTPLMMSVATAPVSLEPTTTAVESTTAVEPAMTASVSAQPSGTDTVTSQPLSPPVATAAPPPPAQVPAPQQPVAVATAPASEPDPIAAAIDAGFLPVPELRSGEVEVPPEAVAAPEAPAGAAGPDSDTATLEERMLAGSTPADASVANSYASASEEEDGLTGMVLKLIKKQQDGTASN